MSKVMRPAATIDRPFVWVPDKVLRLWIADAAHPADRQHARDELALRLRVETTDEQAYWRSVWPKPSQR